MYLFMQRPFSCLSSQDGWNQNHFLTPVSTLERERFRSQPTLPTSSIQMSPVNHPSRRSLTTVTIPCHRRNKTPQILELERVLMCPQLPLPCHPLPCWAGKTTETRSGIISEHTPLCNFITTRERAASTKNSIQVQKPFNCPDLSKQLLRPL